MGSWFSSFRYEVLWLDVDGTLELGIPSDFDVIKKNLTLAPLGRPFIYNDRLLASVRDFIASSERPCFVYLFTAHRAQAAKFVENVLRTELLMEMKQTYGIEVVDVVTLFDPAYGRGPGRYFKDVIASAERALLRSDKHVLEDGDVCELAEGEIVRYSEVLRRENELIEKHMSVFGTHAHKGIMTKYCVNANPEIFTDARITLIDDRLDVVTDVVGAIDDLGLAKAFRYLHINKITAQLDSSEYLRFLQE